MLIERALKTRKIKDKEAAPLISAAERWNNVTKKLENVAEATLSIDMPSPYDIEGLRVAELARMDHRIKNIARAILSSGSIII